MTERDFTPALGRPELSGFYDAAIALLTREGRWRRALLAQIAPAPGDVIVDVGCGTGTLAIMLARDGPSVRVIGVDPDPDILDRARIKASRAGVAVQFERGFASEVARYRDAGATKITSSLVFHQVPLTEKAAGLAACFAALPPGGELHVADYGLQRTPLMRALFRQVQRLDGFENTGPNARGVLPSLMAEAGFHHVAETSVLPPPTGSISLYRGLRP